MPFLRWQSAPTRLRTLARPISRTLRASSLREPRIHFPPLSPMEAWELDWSSRVPLPAPAVGRTFLPRDSGIRSCPASRITRPDAAAQPGAPELQRPDVFSPLSRFPMAHFRLLL